MKDIKKIQEFFSKPLKEGTLDQGEIAIYMGNDDSGLTHIFKRGSGYYGYNDEFDFEAKDRADLERQLKMYRYELLAGSLDESVNEQEENTFKKGDKVTYLGHPAVVTATKEYNGRNFVSVSYDKGTGKTSASMILATSGDVKAVNEMDINDPVMMKMRAAKDKLAKMRAANAGDDGNDEFFDKAKKTINPDYAAVKNAKKIDFLKKERAQLMRDMEQEAEPEGGPIADKYGRKLNRIDAAIAKLSGQGEWGSEKFTDLSYDEIAKRSAMFGLEENRSKMPTQDQVDKFFALTQQETHYLNSKPVAGQEGTFNLMKVEPWDEYDLSNFNSLVRKAKQRGKSIDEATRQDLGMSSSVTKSRAKAELKNPGNDGSKVYGLDKDGKRVHIKSINDVDKFKKFELDADLNEAQSRVSMPRYVFDKSNPNFLNVYIDYDLGPGGSSIALGKETMTGQIRRESAAEAMKLAYEVAKDLEAEYNVEDIDIVDQENGKVRIFAVSDDFIKMNPNFGEETDYMKRRRETSDYMNEASKGAMNYFSDLKFNYQKAFRYLDVEEREEYKQLAKDFFSKLQIDDKVRAVGLEESLNPEVLRALDRFIKSMAKKYGYSVRDAVFAIKAAMKQRDADGVNEGKSVVEKVIAQLKEEKPGLWANIRAKKARGEKPSHGNSDAHKTAVKAGKKINKIDEAEDAEKILADTPDNIEAALAKALKISPDELEKKITSKDDKEKIDESLTVTLLLLLPAILSLVGNISNKIKQKFGLTDAEKSELKAINQKIKDTKEKYDIGKVDNPFNDTPEQKKAKGYIKKLKAEIEQKFGSKLGEDAKKAGHALHHVYTFPIVQFLRLASLIPGKGGKWAKDPKTRQKVADVIYAVGMLVMGGVHMKHGISHLLTKHGIDAVQLVDTVANGTKTGLSFAEIAGEALNVAGVGIEVGSEL